jgi:hypothetical protein
MHADDAYRAALNELARQLNGWAEAFRAHATISIERPDDGLRLLVRPKAAAACGFELVLRPDRKFDIAIAGETFEDQTIEQTSRFRDLAVAISRGDVVRRVICSARTGRLFSVEVEVAMTTGMWTASHRLGDCTTDDVVHHTRYFLPYREKRAATPSTAATSAKARPGPLAA